jgi:hypothetical protein
MVVILATTVAMAVVIVIVDVDVRIVPQKKEALVLVLE